MAKKLIKNYFFTPGVGLDHIAYPDAYSLLIQNKNFILDEIIAFTTNQVDTAAKCERDTGYAIDGVGYDICLDTNYNAIFLGIAETNSIDVGGTVIRTFDRTRNILAALSAVSSSATATNRLNAFFDELTTIAADGRSAASEHYFTEPSTATNTQIAVRDKITNNIDFITSEINAWVNVNYPSHDHDVAKCTRDVKYACYAVIYDVLYGGNSATYDLSKFFFYFSADGSPGTDPIHKAQTVAAYGRLKTILPQIVQGFSVSRSSGNTLTQNFDGGNADAGNGTACANLIQIIADVLNASTQAAANLVLAGLSRTAPSVAFATTALKNAKTAIDAAKTTTIAAVVGFKNYVFDSAKCRRDSGYVIDALIHDFRYGGNEKIRYVASKYWVGSTPQIDGTRLAEYETYYFVGDLITDFIFPNILDAWPEQTNSTQVIDLTKEAEAGAGARILDILDIVVTVIETGLSVLPAEDIQLARIETLGKIDLEDLLLISNVTSNEILYNFSDPTKGGTVEFTEENTTRYPNANTVNNGVTVIRFRADCSTMSSNDGIQIFVEKPVIQTRPYDFGTDAIERMRVAQPQAMIDADFEYGLQPTKWQAIGMQRGYPAAYEVNASDVSVVNVVTDASSGTGGTGASLITVTTLVAHGFTVGQPFTIRALSVSVSGFNRAEGTFIVYSVPTTTTFTYYAKSKVGTSNGQVLATGNTQLRQAGFYTGASVGTPSFTVYSNGSSGSFTTGIQTSAGGLYLNFVGTAPPTGAPISGTGINSGTQISGVFGSTNVDGKVATRYVKTTVGSGASVIELTSVTSLSAGMALDDGAATKLLVPISSIVGTTLNLSGTVTVGYQGDENTYTGSASVVTSAGDNTATLNVTIASGVATATVANAGSGYAKWDVVKVDGTVAGGLTPDNDLYFLVTAISGSGISTVSYIAGVSGTDGTYNAVNTTAANTTQGTGATFTVARANGSYTVTGVTGTMTGYAIGQVYSVGGTSFEGALTTNDCFIIVTSVTGGGSILTSTARGTVLRGDQIPIWATVALSEGTTTAVPASTTISYSAIATLQVTFANPHGFVPGMGLNITVSSGGTNHALAAGPFSVEAVPSSTIIRYTARAPGTIDTGTTLEGTVYVRPDSFFSHRPFDGGVQLGTGGPQHGGCAVRQSKKYIRYQSGKGAMYNTGALFCPSYDIRSATATSTSSGATITIATDDTDHGLQAGAVVKISGVDTTGYNGTYTVASIVDERTFTVFAQTQLGSTTATIGSPCQVALYQWHGAVVRSGPFDDQNGIFFQYNGRELAVGRRSATFQIAGNIAINANSNQVTGTSTRFLDQLQEGDRIVIRGMTHVVTGITSNTAMSVAPDFRGVNNISGVKIAKVIDIIVPQSEWNLDTCDGNGPSGYNIDVTKMQMIGIQFSWYGAGFIDWMFRGPEGNYTFCHRLKGNNLNTEAYMRTGNLPVRYEVLNESARSRLNGALDASQTTITLDNVFDFPTNGTVYVDNELISYSGKNSTTNQLTGCTRGTTLINYAAGATRTYSAGAAATHNDNQGVVLVSNTCSPIISHWGSAYLIDGNFDSDRGYIFNYAATGVSASVDKKTAFLIRLAPSVSNAVTGDLGERELLNRAQLLLQAISVTTDSQSTGASAIVIEGVLNPNNYPTNPANITWNGLATQAAGGQPSFAQIALGGSVTWGGIAPYTQTATVQGALTTTITATSFNIITQSITAKSFNGAQSTTYQRALSTARNDFIIPTSQYDALSPVMKVGDTLSVATFITGGQTVTGITRNYVNILGVDYTRVIMSAVANANSNANAGNDVTVTLGDSVTTLYNRAVTSTRTDFLITNAQATSSAVAVGDTLSATTFITGGQTISSLTTSYVTISGTPYTRVVMSGVGNSSSTAGAGNNVTTTVQAAQTAATYTNTNYLFFTSASWVASGAGLNTRISTTYTKFPSGTTVSGITTRTLASTTVYKVTFTQTSNATIAPADSPQPTFQFGDPQYSTPGETVFSFIANPGETNTLDLTSLKELTTTAIGGRGTFPNGPDVLAINVYKISGTAVNSNIILRWGEAQA